jgi:hypothetical protein
MIMIKLKLPEMYENMLEKLKISVAARYGENNSALNLYNQEFRK